MQIGDSSFWYPMGAICSGTAPAVDGCTFFGWNDPDGILEDTSSPDYSVTVAAPFVIIPLFVGGETAEKTFTGAGNGLWNDPANWTPAGIPTLLDDVVIPNGKRVNAPECIYANSITLNGSGAISQCGATTAENESILYTSNSSYGNSANYGRRAADTSSTRKVKATVIGDVTMNGTSQWLVGGHASKSFKAISIGGDFTMNDSSLFAVYAGPGDMANEPEKGGAHVTVGGSTAIGAGAVVDAFCHTVYYSEGALGNRGTGAYVFFELGDVSIAGTVRSRIGVTEFTEAVLRARGVKGDGSTSQLYGGGHGGKGGGISEANTVGGAAYDNALAPVLPGAPGTFARTWGGGVIRIAADRVSLAGTNDVSAIYDNTFEGGGAAGGSINIRSRGSLSVADTACFKANGRRGSNYSGHVCGGGAGGRIALIYGMDDAAAAVLVSQDPEAVAKELRHRIVLDQTVEGAKYSGLVSVTPGAGVNGGEAGEPGTAVLVKPGSSFIMLLR